MTDPIERRLALQGSYNFRDIGGYETASGRRVRWRTLYRSDALHRLTARDMEALRALGITTLIDLRTPQEIAESGPSPLITDGARHWSHPFAADIGAPADLSGDLDLGRLYFAALEQAADPVRGVFLTLADAGTYPAVVHCAAGKDRTGVTIALVMRALGVADEDIAADYALTDGYLAAYLAQARAAGVALGEDAYPPELLRALPETILALLARLDARYGSTDAFLATCGVPADALDEIRAHLLEEA